MRHVFFGVTENLQFKQQTCTCTEIAIKKKIRFVEEMNIYQ